MNEKDTISIVSFRWNIKPFRNEKDTISIVSFLMKHETILEYKLQ